MARFVAGRAWNADDALVAAKEAAAALGAGDSELQLLRLGENAMFRVRGTDLLLRVARPGTEFKEIVRTLEVARRLTANDVRVAEVKDDIQIEQPIELSSGVVTVWKYYAELPGVDVSFRGFGRELRTFHEKSGELVPLVPKWNPIGVARGRLHRAAEIGVPAGWIRELSRRVDQSERELDGFESGLPRGVIHGDAHAGNVLMGVDGLRLIDLDNVAIGPRESDFVPTLVQVRRFGVGGEKWAALTEGYGLADPEPLQSSPLVRLRELFMLGWLVQQYGNSDAVNSEIELRLSTLDEQPGSLTRWTAR